MSNSRPPTPPPQPPPILAKYPLVVPTFDGTENASAYLRRFETSVKSANYPKDQWPGILSVHLKGSAEKWYANWILELQNAAASTANPPPVTYEQISLALQAAFSSHQDSIILGAKVRARKLKLTESVEEYYHDLMNMLSTWKPNMSDADKLEYLIGNLRNPFMSIVNNKHPKTPEEFLEMARRAEQTVVLETAHAVNTVDFEDRVVQKMDTLTTLVMQSAAQMNNSNNNRRNQQKGPRNYRSSSAPPRTWNNRDRPSENPGIQGRRPNYYCEHHKWGNHTTSVCRLRFSRQRSGPRPSNAPQLWCDYHQHCNHTTNECRIIRKERGNQGNWRQERGMDSRMNQAQQNPRGANNAPATHAQ